MSVNDLVKIKNVWFAVFNEENYIKLEVIKANSEQSNLIKYYKFLNIVCKNYQVVKLWDFESVKPYKAIVIRRDKVSDLFRLC